MVLNRVVITGVGAVTPFGLGAKALWNGLATGKTCLQFDVSLKFVVGRVSEATLASGGWTDGQRREMSRSSQLALLAADEALEQAGVLQPFDHTDTLVNIGTGVADLQYIADVAKLIEQGQSRKVSPYFVPRILNNLPAGYVCMKHKMAGGAESAATACATAIHCIGNAFRAVKYGYARRALAGGTEAAVNEIGLVGFDRMRALAKGDSPDIARPFDAKRQGFVMSEGAGLLFLERLDEALKRKVPIMGEILGFGVSSEYHHISAPHPKGIGAKLCMQRALQDARLHPSFVHYVNAHATSTPTGDAIEAAAIADTWDKNQVAVSSFKGHTGHLLAAAGAIETIGTVFALQEAFLPPNLNFEKSEFQVPSNINILRDPASLTQSPRVAVVNSFGFGGTNAALVIANVNSDEMPKSDDDDDDL